MGMMGTATDPPRSINLSACVPTSPSWPPAGRQRGTAAVVVRRLQLAARDAIPGVGWCGHRAWRKLLRRLAQETRCVCSPSSTGAASRSRPITFGYDAASYAKNFDDGRRPAPYGAVVIASAGDKSAGR
jgi:hypothetical protein